MTAGRETSPAFRSFAEDLGFLREHTELVLLGDPEEGPKLVLVPAWQGRVMTSTAAGGRGDGFGWLNYE
jgi:hypothetical protein